MNFNAVLINEINEQFFDLFNNKDEVNELISLNSFTLEKNNFLKIPKNLTKDNENIFLFKVLEVLNKNCIPLTLEFINTQSFNVKRQS